MSERPRPELPALSLPPLGLPSLSLGIKICGLTRAEDARLAVELGASFLGLNFYPPSPRALEPDEALRVAEPARGRAKLVGVFVNRPAAEVEAIDRAVGLDRLQFHGDESPEFVAGFGARAVKVVRTRGDLAAFAPGLFPHVSAFLFDVAAEGLYTERLYGGSGEAWGWGALASLALETPYFVAGGIRPGNATRALRESRAAGLDVCSGVEMAPGIKDPQRLEQLMKEVHDAFETPRSPG